MSRFQACSGNWAGSASKLETSSIGWVKQGLANRTAPAVHFATFRFVCFPGVRRLSQSPGAPMMQWFKLALLFLPAAMFQPLEPSWGQWQRLDPELLHVPSRPDNIEPPIRDVRAQMPGISFRFNATFEHAGMLGTWLFDRDTSRTKVELFTTPPGPVFRKTILLNYEAGKLYVLQSKAISETLRLKAAFTRMGLSPLNFLEQAFVVQRCDVFQLARPWTSMFGPRSVHELNSLVLNAEARGFFGVDSNPEENIVSITGQHDLRTYTMSAFPNGTLYRVAVGENVFTFDPSNFVDLTGLVRARA